MGGLSLASVEKASVAGWPTGNKIRSKLVLVDLAGSERAGRRSSSGLGGKQRGGGRGYLVGDKTQQTRRSKALLGLKAMHVLRGGKCLSAITRLFFLLSLYALGCRGLIIFADEASARLREAGYINGSLSALGNVVAALGQAELDRPHIPFRRAWFGIPDENSPLSNPII